MPSLRSITALCGLVYFAAVANGESVTCQALASSSNIKISRPLDLDFTTENNEYWYVPSVLSNLIVTVLLMRNYIFRSAGCAALTPACIIKPATAQEVSTVIKTLLKNNETFAVKSGGHNPNNFFASIDGGPLISTADLNEVTYDKDSQTVRVGPGNRWEDVLKVLDGTNVTIVGGRIGNVGVGGYILGGKLVLHQTKTGS